MLSAGSVDPVQPIRNRPRTNNPCAVPKDLTNSALFCLFRAVIRIILWRNIANIPKSLFKIITAFIRVHIWTCWANWQLLSPTVIAR